MVIVIYNAEYGRTEEGRTICPYHSNIETDEKDDSSPEALNCIEKKVTKTVKKLCNKKKKCSLKVAEEQFGNPCIGIYKYLTILYACGKPLQFRFILNWLCVSLANSSSLYVIRVISVINDP